MHEFSRLFQNLVLRTASEICYRISVKRLWWLRNSPCSKAHPHKTSRKIEIYLHVSYSSSWKWQYHFCLFRQRTEEQYPWDITVGARFRAVLWQGLFVAPCVNHIEILFVSATHFLNDNDGTYGFYQIKIWGTVWYKWTL